jgi:hypothetical protein
MSYIRMGHPLEYFKANSSLYVFVSADSKKKDGTYNTHVEDYGASYIDNCSLITLIGRIIERETDDKEYALKMVKILAKKLGVENKLRDHPLTTEEYLEEERKNLWNFKKSEEGKQILKALKKK